MKDLKTADSLPTSSIDGMPSLVETGALNVAHDSPPVAVDAGIPEGSGLENNPSIEEQEVSKSYRVKFFQIMVLR